MGTRNTLFTKTTVEIDQDRYEELIRNELKYEQYKAMASEGIKKIIDSEENKNIKEEEF